MTGFELVIERVFESPRALVFEAWSEARHFSRWFAPHGFTVTDCTMDARPGGLLRFCHHSPEGEEAWISGAFREVVAPERLVFTLGFADADGNRVERPGFALETVVSVTFAEEGRGTRITMKQAGLIMDQGESQGWKESLERLEAFLAEMR